jgi:O-methyltransferase
MALGNLQRIRQMFKNLIKVCASRFGYDVIRTSGGLVRYDVFANLAAAYEQLLTEQGRLVPKNGSRARLLSRLLGTSPSEAYFIVEGLAKTQDIPGDVCEFGVAQGATSALMANEIVRTGKVLHLFDSFAGLPRPTAKDTLKDDIFNLSSIDAYAGQMADRENLVIAKLKALDFDRYVLHRGFIEQVLFTDKILPTRVSFAYVDFDFYEPTKIVLDFLDGVTAPQAIIIVDDYDYFSTGVRTAVQEFLHERQGYALWIPEACYGYFAVLTKT